MLSTHGWKFKISKIINFWNSTSKCTNRARTDLEKFLNLTLVLENSWNFKKVPFVLELSLNFVKSWKYELVLEKYKIRVLSDLWDAQKNFLKIVQNWVKITRYTSKSKVWLLFYSICVIVPFFITGIRIKENKPFHFDVFGWKVHFLRCLIQNWEEIESLKKDESPGIVLEFCFPISVQTLYKLSTFFFKIQIQKIWNLSKETITICWILHFRLTFKIKSASKFWIQE